MLPRNWPPSGRYFSGLNCSCNRDQISWTVYISWRRKKTNDWKSSGSVYYISWSILCITLDPYNYDDDDDFRLRRDWVFYRQNNNEDNNHHKKNDQKNYLLDSYERLLHIRKGDKRQLFFFLLLIRLTLSFHYCHYLGANLLQWLSATLHDLTFNHEESSRFWHFHTFRTLFRHITQISKLNNIILS